MKSGIVGAEQDSGVPGAAQETGRPFFALMLTRSFVAFVLSFFIAHSAMANNLGGDPRTVVLALDMSGGQKPRTGDVPVLQIFANGTIIARALMPNDPPILARLSQKEADALFREILLEYDALYLTNASIEAEMDRLADQSSRIADAPITFLRIALMEDVVEVRIKALSRLARTNPEAVTLNNLYAIQVRLQKLARDIVEANS